MSLTFRAIFRPEMITIIYFLQSSKIELVVFTIDDHHESSNARSSTDCSSVS